MNHKPLYSLLGIFIFLSLNHQDNVNVKCDQAFFCFYAPKERLIAGSLKWFSIVFSHGVSVTRMLSTAFRMQKSFLTCNSSRQESKVQFTSTTLRFAGPITTWFIRAILDLSRRDWSGLTFIHLVSCLQLNSQLV